MATNIDCRDCKFCAGDPDGLYCSHETSQNETNIFGMSIATARRPNEPCGPDAKLFEKAGQIINITHELYLMLKKANNSGDFTTPESRELVERYEKLMSEEKAKTGVMFYGVSLQKFDWGFITETLALRNTQYSIRLELEIRQQIREGQAILPRERMANWRHSTPAENNPTYMEQITEQVDGGKMMDLTGPQNVEVEFSHNNTVMWVSVNGLCKLRCCRVSNFRLTDNRRGKRLL